MDPAIEEYVREHAHQGHNGSWMVHDDRALRCPYPHCPGGPLRPHWDDESYGFGFRCAGCGAHWDATGDLMQYPDLNPKQH